MSTRLFFLFNPIYEYDFKIFQKINEINPNLYTTRMRAIVNNYVSIFSIIRSAAIEIEDLEMIYKKKETT